MDEEAADELVDGERHHLSPFAPLGPVVLPPEGHAVVVERDEPAVGDGDTVRIARQISQHGFWTAEWSLRIDDPLGFA